MTNRASSLLLCLVAIPAALLFPQVCPAAGVPANTTISNTAIIDYEIAGVPLTATATSDFTVVELLDVSLLWQDAANVTAISPENNIVVTYALTNLGNGIERFLLTVDGALLGDDFDIPPANLEIWIDDGDNNWSAITDTLYDGSNGPILNGGMAGSDVVTVFVVADIQAGLTGGDLSNIQLTATSATADAAGETGNPGAEISAAGDGGVNANVGLTGAIANAVGTIEIVSAGVSIDKSVTVIDTLGGNDPHTGATLRYTLDIRISGSNNISNLRIVDPIPNTTTYTAGSLLLNGLAQTDAQDMPLDHADFNISTANAITVDLSEAGASIITPPANFIIQFEVTID